MIFGRGYIKLMVGALLCWATQGYAQTTSHHSAIDFEIAVSTDPPGAYRGQITNLTDLPIILYGFAFEADSANFTPEILQVQRLEEDGSWQLLIDEEPTSRSFCGNAALNFMLTHPTYYTLAPGASVEVPLWATYQRVLSEGTGHYRFAVYRLLSGDDRAWGREEGLFLYPVISEPVEIRFAEND